MSAVAQLARRAKKNLPPDLGVCGKCEGNFTVKEEALRPPDRSFRAAARLPTFACGRRAPEWNLLRGACRLCCSSGPSRGSCAIAGAHSSPIER